MPQTHRSETRTKAAAGGGPDVHAGVQGTETHSGSVLAVGQVLEQQPEVAARTRSELSIAARSLRAARGLSQHELAHRAGVTQLELDRLENGTGSAAALAGIAEAFGYEIVLRPAAAASPPPTDVRGRSRAERDREGRLSERLALNLPEALYEALKRHAASRGRSSAQTLRDAMTEWLDLADPTDGSYFWPGAQERGAATVPYGGLRLTEEQAARLHRHAVFAGVAAGEVVRLATRNMLLGAGHALPGIGCCIESDAQTAQRLQHRRSVLAADKTSQMSAAADASTDPERLAMLATSTDTDVLEAVATNPSTPEPAIVRLALHATRRWRRSGHTAPSPLLQTIALWDSTPSEALDYLFCCWPLHLDLSDHPNASPNLLYGLTRVIDDIWEGNAEGNAEERLDDMDIDWRRLASTEHYFQRKIDAVHSR